MKKNFQCLFAIFLLLPFFMSAQQSANKYYDELAGALVAPNSVLARTSQLGSSLALGVLRSAQWRDYLADTQNRAATWQDTLGYFFMENEVSSFADRCYVLPPKELPSLYATATEYAKKLGIVAPLLLLVDDRKLVDATAACWASNTGFIILGRGLFECMSEVEFSGVLAHQMGVVAQRHQAKMAVRFIPVFFLCLAAMLYSINKIRGGENSISLQRGLACLGVLGMYGVGVALYWSILARHSEYKADFFAGKIDPRNGLAMINAYDRFYRENTGGDLIAAQAIISTELPHLLSKDARKADEFIKTVNTLYTLAHKENEGVGSGIFATHRSLNARRAFFNKLVADQEAQLIPVP